MGYRLQLFGTLVFVFAVLVLSACGGTSAVLDTDGMSSDPVLALVAGDNDAWSGLPAIPLEDGEVDKAASAEDIGFTGVLGKDFLVDTGLVVKPVNGC